MTPARRAIGCAFALAFCAGAWLAPEPVRAGPASRLARLVVRPACRVLVREWRALCSADSTSNAPAARPPRKPPW